MTDQDIVDMKILLQTWLDWFDKKDARYKEIVPPPADFTRMFLSSIRPPNDIL